MVDLSVYMNLAKQNDEKNKAGGISSPRLSDSGQSAEQPAQINPAISGEAAYRQLAAEARSRMAGGAPVNQAFTNAAQSQQNNRQRMLVGVYIDPEAVKPTAPSDPAAANRSFLDRAGLTVSGGAKQFLGSKMDASGAGYEATQGRRDIQNNALREQYVSALEQAKKNLQYAKEDGDDLTVWQNAVDDAQRKLDAMGYVVDNKVQQNATNAARNLALDVSQSGSKDIEKAKDGASALGKFAIDAGTSMTQVGLDLAESLALGSAGIKPGMLPFATRAFGGGTQQARQEGATIGQQLLYGGATAAKEVLTEKMFNVALPFSKAYGGGSFDSVVTKAIGKAVDRFAKTEAGKTVLKSVLTLGASGISEGLEEFIGDWMEWQMPKISGGDVSSAGEQLSNAIYDFAVGAAMGVAGGAADANTYRGGVNNSNSTKTAAGDVFTADTNLNAEAANANYNSGNAAVENHQTAGEKTFAAKIASGELTGRDIDRLVAGNDTKYRQQFEQEFDMKMPDNHVQARRVVQSMVTAGEAASIATRVADGTYSREDSVRLCDTPANAARRAAFQEQTGVTLPSGLKEVEQTLDGMKQTPMNDADASELQAAQPPAAQGGNLTIRSKNAPNLRERRALSALGKKAGVNITVQDVDDLNGYYDPKTNTIIISSKSQNPVASVAAHEIAHVMRQSNRAEWDELEKITRDTLGEATVSKMERVLRLSGYMEDQIADELVSHYIQTIVTDIGVFEELVGVNRSLAQRIADILDEFLRKLKKIDGIGSNKTNDDIRKNILGHINYGEAVNAVQQMKKALSAPMVAKNAERSNSVKLLPNGEKVIVIDKDILKGVAKGQEVKTVSDYLRNNYKDGIDVNGWKVFVTGKGIREFTRSNYTQLLQNSSPNKYSDKMRTASNLEEIVKEADNIRNELAKHPRKDSLVSFNRGNIQMDVFGNQYNAEIVTAINPNNKEIFYDIVNMKKVGSPTAAHKAATGNLPTNIKVPQTAPGVNSYSMQNTSKDAAESKMLNTDHLKELADEHGAIPKGENPARDVTVPVRDDNGGKVRRGARTVLESPHLNDEQSERFAGNIAAGFESYEPIKNKTARREAETFIRERGYDESHKEWEHKCNSDTVPDVKALVLGEYLMMEAAKAGDTEMAMRYASEISAAATRAGQTVQAMRLLKKLTPTGQLYFLNKMVDQMNHELQANGGENPPVLKINKEKAQKLAECEQIKDPKVKQQKMQEAVSEIEQDIADQTPATWWDKINAWRYMAMLGNLRTQVRNVAGNTMFAPLVAAKNLMATGLEKVAIRDPQKRTKAIVTPRDKAYLQYANSDFELMKDEIQGGGKYNEQTNIQQKKRIFKSNALEGWRVITNKGMDKGDEFFSRDHYKAAFVSFMKAQGMTLEILQSGTPAAEVALNNARNYAIKEAQKATFRDANAVAAGLNRRKKGLERRMKNAETKGGKIAWGAANALLEGVIPFTKTPANIMVRGIEYSPLGILKGIKQIAFDVRSGRCTAAEAIDSLCCGLTGTGIFMVGVLGASLGFLNGSIGDDKEGKEEKLTGSQKFSLVIGDKSYTLDWMSPLAMPLFSGVAVYDALSKGEELSASTVLDALSVISEPMLEMSMLQGLNDALSAGEYSSEAKIASFIFGAISDYISQFNPTILGQIARTIDPVSRNSYYYNPTTKGFMREAQLFLNKQIAKIPGLSMTLPARVDAWGREQQNEGGSFAGRLAYNMLSPGYVSTINETPVDKEVTRLYKKLGESSVLPSAAKKYFESDGKRYNLTADEYEEYAKWKGSTAYQQIEKAMASPYYKLLSDGEKAETIARIYKYAEYTARKETKGSPAAPSSSTYTFAKKAEKASKVGLSPAKYITMYTDLRRNYDKDNSGGIGKDEIIYYLERTSLTRAQKKYLFSCWSSSKNNPYA